MIDTPRILLVDDGELSEVAEMLDRLHIDYVRLRGGQVTDDCPPPSHLLIATPRRAQAVREGSPPGVPEGQPLRVISVDEDSNAMRRMLRRMGFQLLVRRGVHPEVWRLLVERAVFQGEERRDDPRVPVGASVSLATNHPSRLTGLLVDVSNRGCRLRTSELMEPGSRLSLAIRLDDLGGDTLHLRGRLVRTATEPSDTEPSYTAAMLFDADLEERDRGLLTNLLNDLSVGPGSLTYGPAEALPPCESPVIPGLTLDAETDPALHAGVKIRLEHEFDRSPEDAPSKADAPNRRRGPRGNYPSAIVATPEDADPERSRVLMGRDLSAEGMRVEMAPDLSIGSRFRLAIYGPAEQDPYLIDARVDRDDGEEGLVLRFMDLSGDNARKIEKLVACLPDVESLADGEASGLGSVISEIISRTSDDDC